MIHEESLRPEYPEITPKKLLKTCQKFADILAHKRWFESQTRKVALTRSFTDSLDLVKDSELINEIEMETEVYFTGLKEVISYDGSFTLLEEQYYVGAKVRTRVEPDELSSHVLARFAEMFDTGDEDTEGVYELTEADKALLANLHIEREQEIGYMINDSGDILEHYLVERFYSDNEVISVEGYNSDNTTELFTSEADEDDEEELETPSEPQPGQMSEADVTKFIDSFEAVMQNILTTEAFNDVVGEIAPPEDEHRRRAMAMIAMISSGYKGIKF